MQRKRLVRRLLVVGCIALVAIGTVVAGHLKAEPAAVGGSDSLAAEMPTALGQHLDGLRQSIPGNGGESAEGPGSPEADKYAAMAYPADAVSLQQYAAARSAFSTATGRNFAKGKGKKGAWVSVGPSQALYPATPFRNSFLYVPNAYVAGGRTTSIAISPTCNPGHCRLWITPAGGGIWRTKNALSGQPHWEYLGGPLGINAAGLVYLDPNDPAGNTVYVGTGEANVCGSGCVAGVGLYKSTDGGDTWTGPLGGSPTDTGNPLGGKGIGDMAVKPGDPNTIYVATTTALRGHSSVCCTGVTRPVPGAAQWGLYKSTNGGASWTFLHNGSPAAADCTGSINQFINLEACSPRGVRHVELDPTNPEIVYAASYARGVWRNSTGGTGAWTQIKPSLNAAILTTRPNIAVTTLTNGKTRMYVYEGHTGARFPTQNDPIQHSRLFRSDDVASGAPVFTDLTSPSTADPGFATFNLCTGQCWYDAFVYTPKGHPDIVYAGGSYLYGEVVANKRGVILSTDAGVSGTDMTFDATDPLHPNGLHPDQHAFVTHPNDPFVFFEANDGGVMRSSGDFVDRSAWCDDPLRELSGDDLARCKQMLSRIPSKLDGMNHGLSTLQFQSLSVSPHNSKILQGGTQDNGTWESDGNPVKWLNTMIGDGGQSGFDVANPDFRFHNFFDVTTEVNFDKGDIADWIWVADPLFGHAGSQFYAPVISDPKVAGTMFAGTGRTAYRTKTHGLGSLSLAEAQEKCNTWFGTFPAGFTCGDWAELGPTRLTDPAWGTRAGGAVASVERTKADTSTAWSATTTGRVFITKNVDAEPTVVRATNIPPTDPYTQRVATAVSWTRLDDDSAAAPGRFVSSIYVDPANGNHAWVSYSGFNSATPAAPGHVFEVTYNPATGTSTWVDRSYDLADLPITDLVYDDVTGDLYASSDFGVLALPAGTTSWAEPAPGLPNVEVAGLTIVPSERILYAATHGLSAWRLNLD
jgi:hypothetical protein